jgi:hypothetical protein
VHDPSKVTRKIVSFSISFILFHTFISFSSAICFPTCHDSSHCIPAVAKDGLHFPSILATLHCISVARLASCYWHRKEA